MVSAFKKYNFVIFHKILVFFGNSIKGAFYINIRYCIIKFLYNPDQFIGNNANLIRKSELFV